MDEDEPQHEGPCCESCLMDIEDGVEEPGLGMGICCCRSGD